MAHLPVESLKTGGLSWFSDLTVCDPFYILPLYSMTSIFLMLEVSLLLIKSKMEGILLSVKWDLHFLVRGRCIFTRNDTCCSTLLEGFSCSGLLYDNAYAFGEYFNDLPCPPAPLQFLIVSHITSGTSLALVYQ